MKHVTALAAIIFAALFLYACTNNSSQKSKSEDDLQLESTTATVSPETIEQLQIPTPSSPVQ